MIATTIWFIIYAVAMMTIEHAGTWWVEHGEDWEMERALRRTQRQRLRAISLYHYSRRVAP